MGLTSTVFFPSFLLLKPEVIPYSVSFPDRRFLFFFPWHPYVSKWRSCQDNRTRWPRKILKPYFDFRNRTVICGYYVCVFLWIALPSCFQSNSSSSPSLTSARSCSSARACSIRRSQGCLRITLSSYMNPPRPVGQSVSQTYKPTTHELSWD